MHLIIDCLLIAIVKDARLCILFRGGRLTHVGGTMGDFVIEIWSFMKERKKFWLFPIIMWLVLLGGLIVLTSGSVVAPFIYTMF